MRNTKQHSKVLVPKVEVRRRIMAAMLFSVLICHILDKIKDTRYRLLSHIITQQDSSFIVEASRQIGG